LRGGKGKNAQSNATIGASGGPPEGRRGGRITLTLKKGGGKGGKCRRLFVH